jgi:3'(2'), 5'-bisphosphate nucleotidase
MWAVEKACALTATLQERLVLEGELKSDLSPVTVADFAAQALVTHELLAEEPGLSLVGEESQVQLGSLPSMPGEVTRALHGWIPEIDETLALSLLGRSSHCAGEKFWTLDPVDGTKGFLRRHNYAVALSWLEEGRPRLGVLGCPRLKLARFSSSGVIAVAERGGGAWVRPLGAEDGWSRLRCSECGSMSQARLLHSFEPAHTDLGEMERLRRRLGLRAPGLGIDSQAKYVVLAAGEGELLLRLLNPDKPDYRERIWDQAAGTVILEEAGGRLSDLLGRDLDFGQGVTLAANEGLLASHGPLHEEVLRALASP